MVHVAVVVAFELDKPDETNYVIVRVEHNLAPDREQEHQESVVVFDADAVVDPGAVVVESFNAAVTNCAMS
jgi:hypothetical protein